MPQQQVQMVSNLNCLNMQKLQSAQLFMPSSSKSGVQARYQLNGVKVSSSRYTRANENVVPVVVTDLSLCFPCQGRFSHIYYWPVFNLYLVLIVVRSSVASPSADQQSMQYWHCCYYRNFITNLANLYMLHT